MTRAADLPAVLQGFPRVDDHLDDRQAMGRIEAPLQAELGVPKDKDSLRRTSHVARGQRVPVLPFEEAAILTVDGVGEWVTAPGASAKAIRIRIKKQMLIPAFHRAAV